MEMSSERIEILEKKVEELEKLVKTLLPKTSINLNGFADIYQYKNSLILISQSKEQGTYSIKDKLKQIGAKWATVTDKDGNKFSGWMILGVCKDTDMETAITSLVVKLKDISTNLEFKNRGQIFTENVSITDNEPLSSRGF